MHIVRALLFVGIVVGGFIYFQSVQPDTADRQTATATETPGLPATIDASAVEDIVLATADNAEDAPEEDHGIKPIEQLYLNGLVSSGQSDIAFAYAFEMGDELTETEFTAEQGVGANIGEGRRFTRVPRADLNGPGEWGTHFPAREGGANATQCISCHNAPLANGAGGVALNVVLDPAHTGDPSLYLERNTTSLFALAIPQRLA